ncbi:zf-C2H2_6 domain-containing protein [Cephalotus follicularis]|uniref:Zf-C2H2_6 domain-containing protein n=1 Tax=Cephalotus follicularis TaxID=3775 RepID=A0A1Q3B3T7_CEPFO|nr:zf-C2H2_6 domain-containing protein [Cephalotus follicularis]
MLLSHSLETKPKKRSLASHVFECNTCNRQFSSFQALGGHRASHKRPRLTGEKLDGDNHKSLSIANIPKMHECSICGLKFSMGQALGGHMRRHRADMNVISFSSSIPVASKLPVLKRSNSSKRVLCLDLNLTPLENDLDLLFGKMATKAHLFT